MRKLFYLLFVVLLCFTSCDPGSNAGTESTNPPKHVAISDADGLFIAPMAHSAIILIQAKLHR